MCNVIMVLDEDAGGITLTGLQRHRRRVYNLIKIDSRVALGELHYNALAQCS